MQLEMCQQATSECATAFIYRYNKTPHNLFLSAKKDGKELGEVAPEVCPD